MAITQTGSVISFEQNDNLNTGTVSTSITVPADAELVIVGVSLYTADTALTTGSLTFTKGGVDTAMTSASTSADDEDMWKARMFYMVAPDTGASKTLKWDWGGTGTINDVRWLASITFWKGIDTASPVRDADGEQNVGVPVTTPTLTCVSGDKIVAFVGFYDDADDGQGRVTTWTNLTELAEVTEATRHAQAAWATADPSGNTTVGISAVDATSPELALCALVLKAAAAATKAIPIFHRPMRFR